MKCGMADRDSSRCVLHRGLTTLTFDGDACNLDDDGGDAIVLVVADQGD